MKWLTRLLGGTQDMAALTAGTKAPDISLAAVDGKTFSLQDALTKGPALAAFFKVSCPVCQYTFPYLERLHKAQGDKKSPSVGISQDDKRNTNAFLKEYGVHSPLSRRSQRLSSLERIRPDQRSHLVPDWAGRPKSKYRAWVGRKKK